MFPFCECVDVTWCSALIYINLLLLLITLRLPPFRHFTIQDIYHHHHHYRHEWEKEESIATRGIRNERDPQDETAQQKTFRRIFLLGYLIM